jgi:hypothetical protein
LLTSWYSDDHGQKPAYPPIKLAALALAPISKGVKLIMTYRDKLNPWCIIRPVSNVQMRIVGRFRRRSDAEGHLQILKRMIPNVPFEIMFDITPEHT